MTISRYPTWIVAGFATFLYAFGAHAQHVATERVLIPVIIGGEIPGAFGSRWTTELVARNTALVPVWIGGMPDQPCFVPCASYLRPPESTFSIPGSPALQVNSGFVYVQKDFIDQVTFNLRVRDLSRQALTWGTEIPVVRESDFRSAIELLNVPTDARFRSTLRVYRGFGSADGNVTIRIFDMNSDSLLVEDVLHVNGPGEGSAQPPPRGEIGSLSIHYPQLSTAERLRIEIVPQTASQPIWAFVSVTNNETQHVTTVTPQ